MRVFKNGETDVMEFDGNLEGLRILSKINADSANTALTHASHQPSYKDCIIDLVCDNEPVYQGDLNSFIQMMFMGAFDTTGRMQYLNAELGQLFVTHVSGVSEQLIADLSVNFEPMGGHWVLSIRMGNVFKSGTANASQLLFDFDKSDDVSTQRFRLFCEPISVASDKHKQIIGNCTDIFFMQSDNEYIATNDGAFNSQSLHPVQNVSINSKYAQCNYQGEELQVLEIANKNGYISFDAETPALAQKTIQKTVRLSDREIMVNPEVNLKLRTASMKNDGSIAYSLGYKVITLLK